MAEPADGSGDSAVIASSPPLATAEDTRAWGARLGALLRAGDLVVLTGGLGAGKTTLTQGLAEGLGVRGPIVSSIGTRFFAGPRVATIYGVIYATNALGAALGSWLGGLLHDFTGGYRWGLAMSLAFIACAAAPFWTVPALRNYR